MLDFMFATPKRHILGRSRMFWRISRQNPSRAIGCSELQEPNKKLTRLVTHTRIRNAWADHDELLHRCWGPRRNHLCRFVLLLLSTSYTKYKISINTKEKQKEKQKKIEKQKNMTVTTSLYAQYSMAAQTSSLLILLSDSTNSPSRTITNSRIISAQHWTI